MKRVPRVLPVLMVLAALIPAPAWAEREPQFVGSRGDLGFSADVASFPDARGGARTELYVSIPLSSLHFTKHGEGTPTTRADITAIFYDKKENQLTGDDWSYHDIPGSLETFENYGRSLDRKYVFRLPSGRTQAKVRVEEPDRGFFGELVFEFDVPDFEKEEFTASDLVFGLCGDMVASSPRGGFVGPVLPRPSRRYGEDTPSICVYARIQDRGDETWGNAYEIAYRIKSQSGRTVEDSTFTVIRSGGAGEALIRPTFSRLTLGTYELEVTASLGSRHVRRRGTFSVDESRISFIRDGEKLRTVLGYVADNEELRELDAAPDDSLQAVWDRFWARRDTNPKTLVNEALQEFLRRVDYAAQNYGVLEPGWRSDRGRIHIKYGVPDNIELILNDSYRPPTEIWYYYSRNATYVFQDLEGFGRFRLVSSNRD